MGKRTSDQHSLPSYLDYQEVQDLYDPKFQHSSPITQNSPALLGEQLRELMNLYRIWNNENLIDEEQDETPFMEAPSSRWNQHNFAVEDIEPRELDFERNNMPIKRSIVFASRGWGAGGVPVDYIKTFKPKLFKVKTKPIKIPKLEPTPQKIYMNEPSSNQNIFSGVNNNKYQQFRDSHFPLFHLFASNGWGPSGRR